MGRVGAIPAKMVVIGGGPGEARTILACSTCATSNCNSPLANYATDLYRFWMSMSVIKITIQQLLPDCYNSNGFWWASPSRVIPTEHDGFIRFDERPLDHRLRQSVPLQYLIIEPHQHFELCERCLPKVLV